jgi:signal transduction histidine kinase
MRVDEGGMILRLEEEPAAEAPVGHDVSEPREIELESLHALGESILGSVPLDETLDAAAAAIRALMPAEYVGFHRYHGDPDDLTSVHPRGSNERSSKEPVLQRAVTAAIRTARPFTDVIVPNGDPSMAVLYAEGMRSILVVPLVAEDRLYGTCQVASARPTPYSEREMAMAHRIASLATLALRGDDLRETELRRRGELEALLRVSESVTRSLDTDRVLATALEQSLEVTGLRGGAVYLVDEEKGELVLAVQRGLPATFAQSVTRLAIARSVLGSVAAEARPRLVRDLAGDPDFGFREDLEASGRTSASMVAVPLIWEDQVIGVIALGTFGAGRLERADLSFLIALSRPIAVAVGNARLYEALKRVNAERRRLLSAVVEAQEEERRSIAEDIHDDTVQVMTAVGMRLHVLRSGLGDPEQRSMLEHTERATTAAIDRLRNLMFELHPRALEREGLAAAVNMYLDQVCGQADLTWHVEDHLHREPPPEIGSTLYRIFLEALANVRKHSRAKRVELLIEDRDGGVFARVRDDGVGFPSEELSESPPGHLGITAIRERARMAGGWCRIDSEPGSGATVECWLPSEGAKETA